MRRALGNVAGVVTGALLAGALALVIAGYAIAFDIEHRIRKARG